MQVQNISAYEKTVEDILKIKDLRKYKSIYGKDLSSHKLSSIYIAIINFCLIIGSFVTLIRNDKYYLDLSKDVCTTRYVSSFTNFWCNIGDYETNIINSYFIFLILFMSVQVFSILIHKDIAKLEIKGILYYILIIIDSIFLILFYIYIPLFLFLCAYSIIVLSTDPFDIQRYSFTNNTNYFNNDYNYNNDYYNSTSETLLTSESNWISNKTNPIVNSILLFFIFIFDSALLSYMKIILTLYINMKYEKVSDEKMKIKTMKIKNNDVEFKVRTDKIINLYSNAKNHTFKEVIIKYREGENEREDLVYVYLDNDLFDNLFSFSSFGFNDNNNIFSRMVKIGEIIFGILFLSVPLSKLHINNEIRYDLYIKLPNIYKQSQFHSIYIIYGAFEKAMTDSRIVFYSITLFFILLVLLKRIIFGGFNNIIFLTISYALCIIFILENIIYMILSLLGALFGSFSIVFDLDQYSSLSDEILTSKIICLSILHFIFFWICLGLLVHSCKLCSMINRVRGQLKLLNENSIEKPVMRLMFTYKGLDLKDYILDELEIPGLPRNAFFSKRVSNNPQVNDQLILVEGKNPEIKSQQILEEENNPIIQNNNNEKMQDDITLNANKKNNIVSNNERKEENIALNNNDNNNENNNQNN